MALPKDNPNALTEAVAAEIKKMGPTELAALPVLDGGDLQLFGALIQYFAFMDLNLRRALESFHAQKMLPKEYVKLWPRNISDSRLTGALAAIVLVWRESSISISNLGVSSASRPLLTGAATI